MKTDIRSLILYEDDCLIVCRKPAGVATQSRRIQDADMESLLKNHLAFSARSTAAAQRKKGAPYLAVIHRLDQPVEGLLVFAKTPAAAAGLNRQLTGSGFGKYYLALVHGVPPLPEGDLKNYLIKDSGRNLSRVCSGDTPGARSARLHYRTERSDGSETLLSIRLETGRHHQIRVQMAAMGCPIAGDRKYGQPDGRSRLMLCACRLEFLHPHTRKRMWFEWRDPFGPDPYAVSSETGNPAPD